MHDRLTWCTSPPRGCDVALRPRGRATGGSHGAQERTGSAATWQEATQSRGPRGRPCEAPRGRLVSGGPTGIVGPG